MIPRHTALFELLTRYTSIVPDGYLMRTTDIQPFLKSLDRLVSRAILDSHLNHAKGEDGNE